MKSEFDLGWAARATSSHPNFNALGRLRSDFASLCIDKALSAAWSQELAAQRIKPADMAGLFILGLGKLGGFDLNFSSDVDLIAYYDPAALPISANKGQKYIVGKVLQRLTRLLKPNHSADFVWRADWRLRPESSAGGLAMTTDEAQNFYFFRALPWHRLALMKARVVAGDIATGETFLSEITPFIWRQNLDFRALDELAHLKSRINLEHPALQIERTQVRPITGDPTGFNVKLGRGGIREIEFIANAQQLVWGGKQYELRTPHTLSALKALSALGHMLPAQSEALAAHYITLRQLENAIQMLGNDQTHILPDSDHAKSQIMQLLRITDWEDYSQNLFTRRTEVNALFDQLFQTEASHEREDTVATHNLTEQSQDIAQSWLSGFNQHGVAQPHLPKFQPLGRSLLARVMKSSANHDDALGRIDAFLKSLSRSEQYLDLLQRNPRLLDALITPLLPSPHMTRLLEQSPHIIDIFLNPQSSFELSTEFIFAESDYETRLERLRRFVNENLFQKYHYFLTAPETGEAFNLPKRLTHLADKTIEAAIQIVCDDLEIDSLEICVLGLGKMATQNMAPMSDIDLIFIFGDAVDSELSSKVVRRLKTTLTTPLREGIAYDLDMRLRPSGRSGPPAVKLSSFQNYHAVRAKTWEHIALHKARIVAGDPNFVPAVEAALSEIWARPRNRTQCLIDAKYMLGLITEERFTQTPPDVLDTKLRRGGLMEADFLWRSFAVAGLMPPEDLTAAIKDWQDLELWERLLGLTGKPVSAIPPRFAKALNGKAIKAANMAGERITQAARDTLFAGISLPQPYEMQPISWDSS